MNIAQTSKQTSRWKVDAALFSVFIAAFFLDATGLEVHQTLGIVAGAFAIYHLVTHWDWVSAITARFFQGASNRSRLYYMLDAVILLGFFTIIGFGLVISSWLDLDLANFGAWRAIHITAAALTLLATLLKVGLHWRWIVSVGKKVFSAPAGTTGAAPATGLAVPASGPKLTNRPATRREFLQLMGVTGIASALALTQTTGAFKFLEAEEATSQVKTVTSATSTESASTASSSTDSASTTSASTVSDSVQSCRGCRHKCSYPGECHDYRDTNGNGLCDNGECA
jgi:hypothetical protein